MIPDDYKVTPPERKEFDLLPEDTYEAVISKLELKKDVPVYQKPDETEDRFNFEFTITEEGEFKGRRQWLEMRPVLSAGGGNLSPSWLYKIFCAVNKIKLSDDEAKMVLVDKINELEGKKLRIVVIQKTTGTGKLRNKVANVLPSKTGKPATEPVEDDTFKIDNSNLPF